MEASSAAKRPGWVAAAGVGIKPFIASKVNGVIRVTSFPETNRDTFLFAIGNRYVRNLNRKPAAPKKRVRMMGMGTFSTTEFSVPVAAHPAAACQFARPRRRQITPQAGKALEKLGHAIEYLTDEFVQSGESFSASNSQLEAVQLLMALNRRVYFECPEVPTLTEKVLDLLHRASN
jgi:hypothetical protein